MTKTDAGFLSLGLSFFIALGSFTWFLSGELREIKTDGKHRKDMISKMEGRQEVLIKDSMDLKLGQNILILRIEKLENDKSKITMSDGSSHVVPDRVLGSLATPDSGRKRTGGLGSGGADEYPLRIQPVVESRAYSI